MLQGLCVLLLVEDDGLGIVFEECEWVFEFFVCFDFSWDWVIGGCGFGLVIVYSIVQVMGGEVCCEVSFFGGVCFCFSWLVYYQLFDFIFV